MKDSKKFMLSSILCGVVLTILALIFSNVFFKHFKYEKILKTGIEVQAEIISDSYSSNLEVMETKYYKIEYIFVDENNIKHQGTTSESLTYADVLNLLESGYINIKYNPETFESIESSYHITSSIRSQMIISGIIIVLDLAAWIIAIVCVILEIRKAIISNIGKEYKAVFISYDSFLNISDTQLYSISYTWKDEYGQIKNGKSKPFFTYHEANALKNAGTFDIKVIGKKSIITADFSKLSIHNFETIKKKKSETFTCAYCCTVYDKILERCPSCGASQNEKNKY